MNAFLKTFLKQLKEYGLRNQVPNISESTALLLQELVKQCRTKNVLEIGSANGYSTIHLADALESFDGHLTSFEVSRPAYEQALDNFKRVGIQSRITLHFGNFLEQAEKAAEKAPFDLIFVDAQKSEYHRFWKAIKPFMHSKTIVVFDDVLKFPEKTAEFWTTIHAESDYTFEVVKTDPDDGVMIIKHA